MTQHKTAYGYDMRVLSCAQCAAPIDAANAQGGIVRCHYCQQQNNISSRDERLDHQMLQAAPQMTEAQRFERLRTQDGKPLMPPPSLAGFLAGGSLPEHQLGNVVEVWKRAKAEVSQGAGYQAQETLYFATLMLRGPMSKNGQDMHVRAMIETDLDVLTEPRHRNVLHGMLARDATRLGDPDAGEKWLALVNPRSDDLHIDTAYRITRAYVSTAKQDYNTVLSVLGSRKDEVPIADGQDALAAVLRANAFERTGRAQEAVAQLQQIMPSAAHVELVGKIIQSNAALQLCLHTYKQAQMAAHEMSTNLVRTKSGVNIMGIVLVSMISMPIVGAGAMLTESGAIPEWAMGIAIGGSVILTIVLIIGMITKGARIKSRLQKSGVRGQATLLQAKGTGVRVNNQPQYELILNIEAPNLKPYRASHREVLSHMQQNQLQPGMVIPILLDPQDPTVIALVWN